MIRATATLKLDMSSIRKKIDIALARSPSVKRLAYSRAYGMFSRAKSAMLREFDRHLITQEIESGPRAANISGTLDGYGNLFSFIGFHDGDSPTEPLRLLLQQSHMEQTRFMNRAWYFRVTYPSQEAVATVTPMPWEKGNSWALAVERDISGLSNYMYRKWGGGRSGMGIQLPYENWEGLAFKKQEYITEILKRFRERINQR